MSDTGLTAEYNEAVKAVPNKPEIKQPIHRTAYKVGRNSPCACGSGKKFKDCHYHAVQEVNLISVEVRNYKKKIIVQIKKVIGASPSSMVKRSMNNLLSSLAIAKTMEEADLILARIDSTKAEALRVEKELDQKMKEKTAE